MLGINTLILANNLMRDYVEKGCKQTKNAT